MSDNPTKTCLDSILIALSQDYEVRGRSKSLGSTEAQLRAAVKGMETRRRRSAPI